MRTVVLPGSFDPFTLGHLDLVRRAARIADQVIVVVSHNPSKRGALTVTQRLDVIEQTLAAEGLTAQASARALPSGLLVDFCRDVGAQTVVRGLRSQLDLAYEEPMARMNDHLAGVDTLFLLTSAQYAHISSSLVREVHALGGDVADMLPPASAQALGPCPRPTGEDAS